MPILVTVDEVKRLGRIDTALNDTLLSDLIDDAENWVQEWLNIKFAATTLTATDERMDGGGKYLWPRNAPITGLTSIKDGWNDDEDITADVDWFFTETRIHLNQGDCFPLGEARWKVTYDYGYTPATAPVGLGTAINMMVQRVYNNYDAKERLGGQGGSSSNTAWQNMANENDIRSILRRFSFYKNID